MFSLGSTTTAGRPARAFLEPGRQIWDGPNPISIVASTGSIATPMTKDIGYSGAFAGSVSTTQTNPMEVLKVVLYHIRYWMKSALKQRWAIAECRNIVSNEGICAL